MNRKQNLLVRRAYFSRWSRKGYGIFASLRVVVKICVLATTYTMLNTPAVAQPQADQQPVSRDALIDQVEISAPRPADIFPELSRAVMVITGEELRSIPAGNLNQLLDALPGIELRQRGAHTVQADLMIRGGTFDQVLVLLNGVNITDPQTGHHNLNIPINLNAVERIEILQGPGTRVYGPGAFSGAINIVTAPQLQPQADIGIAAGQHGLLETHAVATPLVAPFRLMMAASTAQSDGFTHNTDFGIANLFAHAAIPLARGSLDLQAGYQDKAFGANSFYSPRLPNQYEHTSTLLASASHWLPLGALSINPAIYYRRHTDRWEFNRYHAPADNPRINHHITQVGGARVNMGFAYALGRFRSGAELRFEDIVSNVLGDSLANPIPVRRYPNAYYTHGQTRGLATLFADNTLFLGPMALSVGGAAFRSTHFGFHWGYGVDASLRLSPSLRPYASFNSALRFPTFTDLYFSGPNNIGNPNLRPEHAQTLEVGLKGSWDALAASVALFHRRAHGLIDWVRRSADERWTTTNYTATRTHGVESSLAFRFPSAFPVLRRIALGYTYIAMDKEEAEQELQSFYVLDFLRHKASLQISHTIVGGLGAQWEAIWKRRAGSYTHHPSGVLMEYPPIALLNARLHWERGALMLFVHGSNLTNAQRIDIGNVPLPRRWVSAGVRYQFR